MSLFSTPLGVYVDVEVGVTAKDSSRVGSCYSVVTILVTVFDESY